MPAFHRPTGRLPGFPSPLAHQLTSTLAHYRGFIKTGAEGAHHHPLNPLNPLNPMNLLNPHAQRACPKRRPPPPFEPSEPSGLQGRSILKPFLTKWQNHPMSLRHVISNFLGGGRRLNLFFFDLSLYIACDIILYIRLILHRTL